MGLKGQGIFNELSIEAKLIPLLITSCTYIFFFFSFDMKDLSPGHITVDKYQQKLHNGAKVFLKLPQHFQSLHHFTTVSYKISIFYIVKCEIKNFNYIFIATVLGIDLHSVVKAHSSKFHHYSEVLLMMKNLNFCSSQAQQT